MPEQTQENQPQSPPLHPRYWIVWIGFGLLRLLVMLPYRAQLKLGAGMGWLIKKALKSRYKVARRNLEVCFPEWSEEQRQKVLDGCFRSLGQMLFEVGFGWWGSERRHRKLFEIEGIEELKRISENGQGVLLLSGHFTTFELCGRLSTYDGPPMSALYREHGNAAQEWLVKRSRLKYADKMFDRSESRSVVRYLRKGGVVWYAPDQDYERGDSIFLPFFGIPASTILSTHHLARMGRAKYMLMDQIRLPNGQGYRINIRPIEGLPTKDVEADLSRINEEIEATIRQSPEQYMWLHRRFKNRPEGEPSIY